MGSGNQLFRYQEDREAQENNEIAQKLTLYSDTEEEEEEEEAIWKKIWDYILSDLKALFFGEEKPFKSLFDELIDAISTKIDEFNFAVEKLFKDLSIEKQFYDFAKDFKDIFYDERGNSILESMLESSSSSIKDFRKLFLNDKGKSIMTDLSDTLSSIKSTLSAMNIRLWDIQDQLYYFFGDPYEHGYEFLDHIVETNWKYFRQFSASFDKIDAHFDGLNTMTSQVHNLLNQIKESLSDLSFDFDFDFDKLKEILESLDFSSESENSLGALLSQAIKTAGEIIMTGIETIGSIIDTTISEISKSFSEILDFLNSLLDKIIKLIIPENLDFLDSTLEPFSDKIHLKFSFIFDSIDVFKSLFDQQGNQFEDVTLKGNSSSLLGQEINFPDSSLPLSKFNLIGQYIKPFLNAFVLLWFLLDMYKWIHERGAILE